MHQASYLAEVSSSQKGNTILDLDRVLLTHNIPIVEFYPCCQAHLDLYC